MVLVVVGDFDEPRLRALIQKTFGEIKDAGAHRARSVDLALPPLDFKRVTGTFAPFLGTDGEVAILYRTKGSLSPDYYAFVVLSEYLNKKLFDDIRIDRGLSYDPGAGYSGYQRFGIFGVSASTDFSKMAKVKGLLLSEIKRIKSAGADPKLLAEVKRGLLLDAASGFEANSSFADYYLASAPELKRYGRLVKYEDRIAAVSAADIKRVVTQYLKPTNGVVEWVTPTVSYTEFYITLAVVGAAVLLVGWYFLRFRYRK